MLEPWLVALAALAVGVTVTARRLEHVPLSEPLLALALGVVLGPRVLGVVDLPEDLRLGVLGTAARLTLAISLMAVALRFPLTSVLRRRRPVLILLLVALPGMAVMSALTAWATLGLGVGAAVALGATLAPTDPVLASTSVSGEAAEQTVPAGLRQDLSLESGANDGLAFPLVVVTSAVAVAQPLGGAALEAVWSVAGAVLLGAIVGGVTSELLVRGERHGDVDPAHELTFSLVLSIGTLGLVDLLQADGLLAVFVAGLVLNGRLPPRERGAEQTIDESINQVLILPLFALLGVLLPWQAWLDLGWRGVGFAAAVLLVRRLPVVLMLSRPLHLRSADALWLGWFGPIGVAALLYLVELTERGVTDPHVWAAGTLAVTASTVLHGVTSAPGRALYGRAVAHRRT